MKIEQAAATMYERIAQEEAELDRLCFALISRVLSDEEMDKVESLGARLFIRNEETYSDPEIHMELRESLLQQFKMRDIANRAAKQA